MARKVVCCRGEAKDNMQDARNPDELLRKMPREEKVGPREHKGEDKHESKEDDGVGVEGKSIGSVVNATAVEEVVAVVAFEREARDGSEAKEDEDELEGTYQIGRRVQRMVRGGWEKYEDAGP